MPRLPPVKKSPQTRLRATFWPGVGNSVVDLRPVALEFLGDQLGEAGKRALAHFGAGDADDDGFVGLDHDPGVDLRRAGRGAQRLAAERNVEAERQAAAGGGRRPGRRGDRFFGMA